MKFLSFCFLVISNICLASDPINLDNINSSFSSDGCIQRATSDDITGVSNELKRTLVSNRYCIQKNNYSTQIALKNLPDAQTILGILKRYKNEYALLKTDEQKVVFADAFLTAASYQYPISYENIERAKPMTIIFKRTTKGGSITGHALSLFQQDNFDKDREKAFIALTSDSSIKKIGHYDILKRIQYILNGEQNKFTEQVGQYNRIFKQTSLKSD